ncbi:ATP phosphoribosyltransferase regulatory subunit [Mitsuaria sp. PDC51]|jgi:ATP phosphoribosyltransferase regulatory subunit|uniref:ATP phosphoribosyltransferase regulatory subunit n=1 Tax=unclassified Roseateles TaxID=2626991 RepID=UPI0008F07F49|nr:MULTISPECIES: ATP phosphoribosyltransferase regulatory subunit [unclassified Roseateles]MBB3280319.1 ATP phosphoribosyltransferase regulatory subunit [Mitsuaria sp. BK037]MBB3292366.1 ATP phosphoribosyltransferase regulatory subunit [Mitsuaria sp. BK041]MBB3361584.1 ATP phosphoribosyltransferase regulatory subunit [Mitsuaria sp. BK045]SFR74683.1 ATP phosphoribosyltransferase regulatory subunit [Mitsuaria sp. PDC51]
MASAWLLPEHIADVLPSQARRIEELRRELLDMARTYGCELVMPPMLEHLDSLLSGTGQALDLKTFKLVDQLSGRSLGLRADTTPQVARIDAHLLNRAGVTRLCYCGPVLHTRAEGLTATREPLQFGVEIYGHAGLEADLEAQELAIDAMQRAGLTQLVLDLGDARLVRGVLGDHALSEDRLNALVAAMAAKDAAGVAAFSNELPDDVVTALQTLLRLYGGVEVLADARRALPANALVTAALDDLEWLIRHLRAAYPDVRIGVDLADLPGFGYYSGVRFALYAVGGTDAVLRGGRYDEVGAVFGRRRPAVGFSLDLKTLVGLIPATSLRAAVRAPWGEDPDLRAAVRRLREQGETVVCVLPGHEQENDEFECDRELVQAGGQWVLRSL